MDPAHALGMKKSCPIPFATSSKFRWYRSFFIYNCKEVIDDPPWWCIMKAPQQSGWLWQNLQIDFFLARRIFAIAWWQITNLQIDFYLVRRKARFVQSTGRETMAALLQDTSLCKEKGEYTRLLKKEKRERETQTKTTTNTNTIARQQFLQRERWIY